MRTTSGASMPLRDGSDVGELCCHICGSDRVKVYHDQDYRRLMRCKACRIVFAYPLPSRDEKHAVEHEAYEGDILPEVADFFRNCHRDFREDPVIHGFRDALRWMGQYRQPGRLLDVGSGTGIFVFLAEQDFGWRGRGIDVCEKSADKAREEFGVTLDIGDFETVDYAPSSFEAVSMLDVLEHTLDPVAFLRRAFELLTPGGVLYVAVPNQQCLLTVILDRWIRTGGAGRRWFLDRLYVRPHTFYFNPQALTLALERAGFEIVGLTGGNVYLGRYRLRTWMRVPMEIVLRTGSLLGMSAKVHVIGRKPGVPQRAT
jgi:SAM-dependent methyltransferase